LFSLKIYNALFLQTLLLLNSRAGRHLLDH